MTTEELKEFLFHSMRLKADHLPNHHIDLYFECEQLAEEELDAFVDQLQGILSDNQLGELLLYAIHENNNEGNFKLLCFDHRKIKLTFTKLLPLLQSTKFFEFGYATMFIPTKSGGYRTRGESFGMRSEGREDPDEVNAHLPIPPGCEPTFRTRFEKMIMKLFGG
ncbi:MAG: hypothetical protein NXI10_08580 [bacterium]|nr:hypothetical protein [bacterium]